MASGEQMDSLALLLAALEGLQLQKQRIEKQIETIEKLIRSNRGRNGNEHFAEIPESSARQDRLSEEGRSRISLAQKQRWEAYRQSSGKGITTGDTD